MHERVRGRFRSRRHQLRGRLRTARTGPTRAAGAASRRRGCFDAAGATSASLSALVHHRRQGLRHGSRQTGRMRDSPAELAGERVSAATLSPGTGRKQWTSSSTRGRPHEPSPRFRGRPGPRPRGRDARRVRLGRGRADLARGARARGRDPHAHTRAPGGAANAAAGPAAWVQRPAGRRRRRRPTAAALRAALDPDAASI